MKFLSLLVFLVAMVWTWGLVRSIPKISFETHVGIHDNLANYIEQALLARKPNAKDFRIHRLWTEETKPEADLKANFTYSFAEDDDNSRTTIQGWAILTPVTQFEGEEVPAGTRWRVKEVHPLSDSVVFEQGSVIKAGEDEPTESTQETDSGAANAAPAPLKDASEHEHNPAPH